MDYFDDWQRWTNGGVESVEPHGDDDVLHASSGRSKGNVGGAGLTLTPASLTGGMDAIVRSSMSDRKHGHHVNLSTRYVFFFIVFS